jgi:hypothetical protein
MTDKSEKSCETCEGEFMDSGYTCVGCNLTTLSRWKSKKPVADNHDKVEYEKERKKLIDYKVLNKFPQLKEFVSAVKELEALALAEGRKQALKEVGELISNFKPKTIYKMPEDKGVVVLAPMAQLKQAIDQLRNKGIK